MAHACIGDRGANALMHALACNRIIKTLSVRDNKLTSQGFVYVLNGMLRRVDPYGNSNALRADSPSGADAVRYLTCSFASSQHNPMSVL
jgi:hypothetical protein